MLKGIINSQLEILRTTKDYADKHKAELDEELKDKALLMLVVDTQDGKKITEGIIVSNLKLEEQTIMLSAMELMRNKLQEELVKLTKKRFEENLEQ